MIPSSSQNLKKIQFDSQVKMIGPDTPTIRPNREKKIENIFEKGNINQNDLDVILNSQINQLLNEENDKKIQDALRELKIRFGKNNKESSLINLFKDGKNKFALPSLSSFQQYKQYFKNEFWFELLGNCLEATWHFKGISQKIY